MLRTLTAILLPLALVSCTTFFDTERVWEAPLEGSGDTGADATDAAGDAGVDAGGQGACCFEGRCQVVSGAACTELGGNFTDGVTCADVPCGPDCEQYCTAFNDACSVVADDYTSIRTCVDFCRDGASWERGRDGDVSGNTVGCRIYHAETAATPGEDREFHCGHAGITGDTICGSLCENYCHLMQSICTGDNAQYDSFEDCTVACQGNGPVRPAIPQNGENNDTVGDSIQCRMYHVSAAFFSRAPEVHCPHASYRSTVDTCGFIDPPGP